MTKSTLKLTTLFLLFALVPSVQSSPSLIPNGSEYQFTSYDLDTNIVSQYIINSSLVEEMPVIRGENVELYIFLGQQDGFTQIELDSVGSINQIMDSPINNKIDTQVILDNFNNNKISVLSISDNDVTYLNTSQFHLGKFIINKIHSTGIEIVESDVSSLNVNFAESQVKFSKIFDEKLIIISQQIVQGGKDYKHTIIEISLQDGSFSSHQFSSSRAIAIEYEVFTLVNTKYAFLHSNNGSQYLELFDFNSEQSSIEMQISQSNIIVGSFGNDIYMQDYSVDEYLNTVGLSQASQYQIIQFNTVTKEFIEKGFLPNMHDGDIINGHFIHIDYDKAYTTASDQSETGINVLSLVVIPFVLLVFTSRRRKYHKLILH